MKLRGRFCSVALVGVLGAATARGGDGTGPGPSAASVTGVAGDGQTGSAGAFLAFPLSFTTLNSSGQPLKGVHVTWNVSPTGAVTFVPRDSTTDASGSVSTSVRAGSITGSATISAKVTGVSDVVYHVTVVDPCQYLIPIGVGETADGALTGTDCLGGLWYYDFYKMTVTGQQNIRIDMHAGANDTYLLLWSGASPFPFVAFNDDSILNWEGARSSQLDVALPAGDYIIGATSFGPGDRFAYTLAPKTRLAAMGGCREVWLVSGISLSDDISAQDCADSAATPHYYDVARIFVPQGMILSAYEQSTAINPALALYKVVDTLPSDTTRHAYVRELVASNDDSSGTNTNAFVQLTVDTSNYYDLIVSTSTGGEIGAYTLSVDVKASPSARFPTPANRAREWWRVAPGETLWRARGMRSKKL